MQAVVFTFDVPPRAERCGRGRGTGAYDATRKNVASL